VMDCISILDGDFMIVRVTPGLFDETEELLTNISLNEEFGCLTNNLKDSPLASLEFRKLVRHILTCGISFAIKHLASGRIVAAVANMIFNANGWGSYDNVVAEFKSPNMLNYVKFWEASETSFNIYTHWQLDSMISLEYVATLPDFRGRGLAYFMCQQSIDFGRLMGRGELPPDLLSQLPVEMQIEIPQGATSMSTTPAAQKCGIKIGMKAVHRWNVSELRSLGPISMDLSDSGDFEYVELQAVRY
ncbi:hypothetical protein KR009_003625, partial [Drosophila setifemur]